MKKTEVALLLAVAAVPAGIVTLRGGNAVQAQSTDLCAGFAVNDKAAKPFGTLAKPALLQQVTDPTFGGKFRRITAGPGNIIPMYSTVQPWNADETRLILYKTGSGHLLFDGQTYAPLGSLFGGFSGPSAGPTDLEQIHWLFNDPCRFVYPSIYNRIPALYEGNVCTKVRRELKNFSGPPLNCGSDELEIGNDPQLSPNHNRIGLQCGQTSSSSNKRQKKFVYDIDTDTIYDVFQADGNPNAPVVMPSKVRSYFEGQVRNVLTGQIERQLDFRADDRSQHACAGSSDSGADTYNIVSFAEPNPGLFISHNMVTGVRTEIISKTRGWGYPPSGSHISCVSNDRPGWSVVSTTGLGTFFPTELMLVNADQDRVCRVARHRSEGPDGPVGYWGEAHPVMSRRGNRVVFGSDGRRFNGGDTANAGNVDVYVLELSQGPPPTPTPIPSVTPTPTPGPGPTPTPTPFPTPVPTPTPSAHPTPTPLPTPTPNPFPTPTPNPSPGSKVCHEGCVVTPVAGSSPQKYNLRCDRERACQ